LDGAGRACYNRHRQRRASGVSRRGFSFCRFLGLPTRKGERMKNPLDSLWGTIISGLVLTIILYFIVKNLLA
jgi:uncharacterized membrane protein YkvI